MTDEKNKKEKRHFCCWNLDEEEIHHVAKEVLGMENTEGLIEEILTEDEIQQIIEGFKDRLSFANEQWEELLRESVMEVSGEINARMLATFKRELGELHRKR